MSSVLLRLADAVDKIFPASIDSSIEVHVVGLKIFDIVEFGTSKRQSPRACSRTEPYYVFSISDTTLFLINLPYSIVINKGIGNINSKQSGIFYSF